MTVGELEMPLEIDSNNVKFEKSLKEEQSTEVDVGGSFRES